MIRDRDRLRTVWLFGKPYWWERLDGGRLALRGAVWNLPSFRARWLELGKETPMSGYPTPEQRKAMEGVEPGPPPPGPAGASSANLTSEEETDA